MLGVGAVAIMRHAGHARRVHRDHLACAVGHAADARILNGGIGSPLGIGAILKQGKYGAVDALARLIGLP